MLNKAKKQRKKEKARQKAKQTTKRISGLAFLISAATLVGGLGAIFTFLPRVSVSASAPVDPQNPFSSSFTITNTNFIPLRDVEVGYGIGQIVALPAVPDPNHIPSFTSRVTRPEWQHHRLDMDEKFTIALSDFIAIPPPASLGGADIAVVVSYRPWILPLHREKVFRFIAKRQTNAQFYWYSYPITAKLPATQN